MRASPSFAVLAFAFAVSSPAFLLPVDPESRPPPPPRPLAFWRGGAGRVAVGQLPPRNSVGAGSFSGVSDRRDRAGRGRDARRARVTRRSKTHCTASHRIDWRCGAARSSGAKIDRPLAARSPLGELARNSAPDGRSTDAGPPSDRGHPPRGRGNDVDGRRARSLVAGGILRARAARARRGRSIGDDWRRRFLQSCGSRAEGIAGLVGDDELLEAQDTMGGEEEEGRW